MKLLFFTQKVDADDDVLGFVHGWLKEFSLHFDKVIVVCLYKGRYNLPPNVVVLSLGKEESVSKIGYILRFYKYVWHYRKEYNAVFVHMNSIYVLLGGILWKLWNKKTAFWFNHTFGNWKDRVAFHIADPIFHTSPFAFSAHTKKSVRMPAGINTDLFKPYQDIKADENSLVYVGRLSRVKNVDTLIEAALLLDKEGVLFTLDLYGSFDAKDPEYALQIKTISQPLIDTNKVRFLGSLPNEKMSEIYNTHQILINLTPRGNYDKTVLEAMSCEKLVVVSSPAFADLLPQTVFFKEKNSIDLAQTLRTMFLLSEGEKEKLGRGFREKITERHSLQTLVTKVHALLL
ncbi:MAG: glycosyltransferase family 4 protein [bacterium]|nr:glycosyltransferase family 4 protein [bacterium]